MKDPRGVERGACTVCSCKEYNLESGAKRAACTYCECPAPAHTEIATTPKTNERFSLSSLPSASSSFTSTSLAPNVLNVIEVPSGDSFLNGLFASTDEGTPDEPTTDEIFLPVVLSNKLDKAMKKGELDANIKSGVVREVYCGLLAHGQTSNKHLKKAAKKVVMKWSPMKDPLDRDQTALFEKLRRRRDRLNRTPAPKVDELMEEALPEPGSPQEEQRRDAKVVSISSRDQ